MREREKGGGGGGERERENGKRLESERGLCPCLLRDRATH